MGNLKSVLFTASFSALCFILASCSDGDDAHAGTDSTSRDAGWEVVPMDDPNNKQGVPIATVANEDGYRLSVFKAEEGEHPDAVALVQIPRGSKAFIKEGDSVMLSDSAEDNRLEMGCVSGKTQDCAIDQGKIWKPNQVSAYIEEIDPVFSPGLKLYGFAAAERLTLKYVDSVGKAHSVIFPASNGKEALGRVLGVTMDDDVATVKARSQYYSDYFRFKISCSMWDMQVRFERKAKSDHPFPSCGRVLDPCLESSGRDEDAFKTCVTSMLGREWPTDQELKSWSSK